MAQTLALAREKGVVETINLEEGNQSFGTCELFSHLIVIDFESTCWKDQKNGRNEIIEFPAVLLCLKSGKIVDEFRNFVSPVENPRLSDFCIELTGITQEQVEGAVPLKVCINFFKNWLQEMKMKHNINAFAIMTWSDWDLNICLRNECNRKSICKPDVFNRWIDLRALYKGFTKRPPRGLRDAVENEGLIFIGREHSGIDDARNTALLAMKLISSGMVLRITKDLTST